LGISISGARHCGNEALEICLWEVMGDRDAQDSVYFYNMLL